MSVRFPKQVRTNLLLECIFSNLFTPRELFLNPLTAFRVALMYITIDGKNPVAKVKKKATVLTKNSNLEWF